VIEAGSFAGTLDEKRCFGLHALLNSIQLVLGFRD
jgi:hypothetical protein